MFVSRITQISKTKFQVTTDNGDVFLLKERDILLYHIKEGQEIRPDDLSLLVAAMRKECLRRSGNLLQSRDYSISSLREKLTGYGFLSSIIQYTLEELMEAGYLNDDRMTQNYIRYHLYQIGDKSIRRIKMDLQSKGIRAEVVERALKVIREENEGRTSLRRMEMNQIEELLRKKKFDASEASWEDRQKMMAFLYRRGYSQDLVRSALRGGE